MSRFGKIIRNLSINSSWHNIYFIENEKSLLSEKRSQKILNLQTKTNLKYLIDDPEILFSYSDKNYAYCFSPRRFNDKLPKLNNESAINDLEIPFVETVSTQSVHKNDYLVSPSLYERKENENYQKLCSELLNISIVDKFNKSQCSESTPRSILKNRKAPFPSLHINDSDIDNVDGKFRECECEKDGKIISQFATANSKEIENSTPKNTPRRLTIIESSYSPVYGSSRKDDIFSINCSYQDVNLEKEQEESPTRSCEARPLKLTESDVKKYSLTKKTPETNEFSVKRELFRSPLSNKSSHKVSFF